MNIPFAKVSITGNELKYIKEVLESGWLTSASKAMKFEREFAKYIGVKYACAVNSCTSALHLSIEAIGIGPGDQVLVPSHTFTASAEVVRYMGADPVFTDVEYGTGLLTPEILEEALKKYPKVKALILVHFAGQSPLMTTADGKGISDICKREGIRLIEDTAHAFPTKFENRFAGTFGDAGCFSFYANKTITTGEGGMLVTNDNEIYQRSLVMRLHGINRNIWDRFTSIQSTWEYDVVAPGYKYNMPDINAAIGLAQMEQAEYFRNQRQRCAEYYFENLADLRVIDLPVCKGPLENHSWHLFPIVIRPEAKLTRNEFIVKMTCNNIGTSVHYKPLHRMTYYKDTYNLSQDDFPNTEKIWKGTVSLPIFPELKIEELEFICKSIKEILRPNN
jgi:dTDP-4-amino-4,6-dideoxygalactose transaminase